MSVPPLDERDVVGGWMPDFPIYLRHVIVYPSFAYPARDVGIQVVVVLQSVGVATRTIRRALLVAVNAERADTETYPRFGQQDGPFQIPNQLVDVGTSPSAPLGCLISFAQSIFLKTFVVREWHTCDGIGIKIVVHVNGVHIITTDNVAYDAANELPAFRQAGVE